MLPFFRKIRQRLLSDRRLGKYLLYAAGEILLVMVGILLALEVNDWNEKRLKQQRSAFAMEQLTRGVQVNHYANQGLEDEVRYQLLLMDTLLNHPDTIDPRRIPGILQVLDEFAPRQVSNDAWYLSYLDFDPTDSIEFQIATYLRGFNTNQQYFDQGKEELGLLNVMKTHLQNADIPRRVLGQGQSYRSFIGNYEDELYSERDLLAAASLIRSDAFLDDLKTLREYRSDILTHIDVTRRTNEQFLRYLRNNFTEIDRLFEPIQLVGSATPSQSWAEGYPMESKDPDWNRWVIDLELSDGLVKFRAGNSWVFDWGRGEFNPDRLVFKGADIPVKAGRYRISIDILQGTYELEPIR